MARRTIQVQRFYDKAKEIGLKRGEFSATSPVDKNGEYQSVKIAIYARLTVEQVCAIAEDYDVVVYKRAGKIKWHTAKIEDRRAGLTLWDLDQRDDYGLYHKQKLDINTVRALQSALYTD
jgi:hypothetical protein